MAHRTSADPDTGHTAGLRLLPYAAASSQYGIRSARSDHPAAQAGTVLGIEGWMLR
jgi:hypothetical protein